MLDSPVGSRVLLLFLDVNDNHEITNDSNDRDNANDDAPKADKILTHVDTLVVYT